MKHLSKSFLAGFAGTLGAGTALVLAVVVVGTLAQREIKRTITDLEGKLKEQTEKMMRGDEPTI